MDVISHGLWGGLGFGRGSRKSFWLAFFFGIAPDLFSFGIFLGLAFFGLVEHPDWSSGQHPDPAQIPAYVHSVYNVTHSLIVFSIVFGIIWLIRKKSLYALSAWGLHILMDIPTHSNEFFPTPFLWPIADVSVNGIPWSNPIIMVPNLALLIAAYFWFWYGRCKKQSSSYEDLPLQEG